MHFLNHKLLTLISRLLLAAILFMQYSLASQACITEVHPAMAFAAHAMPDCTLHNNNTAKQGNSDNLNPNACFVHCTANDQTLDMHHAGLNVPAILPVATLTIAISMVSFFVRFHPLSLHVSSGGPPLYLLLQNFRN